MCSGWRIIPRFKQHGVEEAVVADDAFERIDAQQEGSPERQHDDEQQQVLGRLGTSRDGVGHRVADRKADEGREEGGAQRIQVGDPVHLVREQIAVVAEVERQLQVMVRGEGDHVAERWHPRHRLGEADLEGEGERDQEKNQQEDQGRQDDEPAARTPGRFHVMCFARARGLLCAINSGAVQLLPVRSCGRMRVRREMWRLQEIRQRQR